MIPPLHDFQHEGVGKALAALTADPPVPLLQVAPTGTGKTVMQCAVIREMDARGHQILQVVPSMEIAAGFARWFDLPLHRPTLEAAGIFTAKRLVNVLAAGELDPSAFIGSQIDEAHHSVDETHQTIDTYFGSKPRVGWTATGYRGTPQETGRLHEWWANNVQILLSETDAVARGYASAPTVEIWPLVNDETVSITKGEFSTVGLEAATEDALEELVSRTIKKFWDRSSRRWDRPTMLTLPTVYLVEEAQKWFSHYDAHSLAVTGETTGRQDIFESVIDRRALLIQVKVVGEGVDLPIRRLIDASPTMSPVFWRQRIGREMRPVRTKCDLCMGRGSIWPGSSMWNPGMVANAGGVYICPACNGQPQEPPPEYIVTNHNLLRHGYLLKGVLPTTVFREAVRAWGPEFQPSRRMVARVAGLQGLGRFVPSQVPIYDGTFWWMFVLGSPDGAKHYASLVNPAGGDPIVAVRNFEVEMGEDGKARKNYNKAPVWKRIKRLPDVTGYTSVPPDPLTPGMKQWWDRAARLKGLDPEAEVNSRVFQVLPLLTDIGGKFREGGTLR